MLNVCMLRHVRRTEDKQHIQFDSYSRIILMYSCMKNIFSPVLSQFHSFIQLHPSYFSSQHCATVQYNTVLPNIDIPRCVAMTAMFIAIRKRKRDQEGLLEGLLASWKKKRWHQAFVYCSRPISFHGVMPWPWATHVK